MRVLALVPYPVGRVPGQRYRIEQWATALRSEGIDMHFSPFLSERGMDVLYERGHHWDKLGETIAGYGRRTFGRTQRYDLKYVYREIALLAPTWLEALLAGGGPLVFDFDDALYVRAASAANAWVAGWKSRRKIEWLCERATHVIVGNETLAGFARAHARDLSIVPSTVDASVYTERPRSANARPVIGWTGSWTTLTHLQLVIPALIRLRHAVDYELRVIGGAVTVPGVDCVSMPWRAESEVEDLRPIDVGLMPLPNDDWSRGKCGMKAIQYMALGIPPVVSPVGFNAALVEHGKTGLHATTEDEWVASLSRLMQDADLRSRLGAAARSEVLSHYTAQVQVPRVASIFRQAAG